MEEVIKKSDAQLKNILDDLVDYKKHSSKKDPLIKELSKQKQQQQQKSNINSPAKIINKPGASLNSSTYSSAASSSSSSSASDSSTSSTTSSSDSSSTTSSSSSSTSSSPSQSQNGLVTLNVSSSVNNSINYKNKNVQNNQQENGKLEMAKMEDLGKRGNFVEIISLVNPSDTEHLFKCTTDVNNTDGANFTISGQASELTLTKIHKQNDPDILNPMLSNNNAANNNINNSESTWKTKRDKRRKKPVEKEITARDIPGNIGDRTVEELEFFIKSGTNGGSNNSNKTKNNNNNNNKSTKPPINKFVTARQQQTDRQRRTLQTMNQQNQLKQLQIKSDQPQQQLQQSPPPPPQQQQQQQSQVPKRDQNQAQTKPIQISQKIQDNQPNAVIFANHIRVRDEDTSQYTFGFFEDQTAQVKKLNTNVPSTKIMNTNQSSHTINLRKQQNTHSEQSIKTETKQKLKQSKPSPNSDMLYKHKDEIDVNSFNYEQILKFISDSWKNTQLKKVATQNH